jgi:hypothetical protein
MLDENETTVTLHDYHWRMILSALVDSDRAIPYCLLYRQLYDTNLINAKQSWDREIQAREDKITD